VRRPEDPSPSRARLKAALLTLAAAVSGCGGGQPADAPEAAGALFRLLESAAEAAPADRAVERLMGVRIERKDRKNPPVTGIGTGGTLVTLVRPLGRSEDQKDFLPAFVVRGQGAKAITYKEDFERDAATTVTAFISCYGEGTERARVALLDQDGKAVERTEWTQFDRRREPRVLEFPLAEPARRGQTMSGVALEFEGRGAHGALIAMDVLRSPVGAAMPEVGVAPAVFVAGDQSRTSAGLVEGSAWSAGFETPGRSRIHLSLHWPFAVRRGGERPEVTVRAVGPAGRVEERFRIPVEAEEGWVDMDLDLGAIGEGAATLELEVDDGGDDGRTAAVLLGDAVITSPSSAARTVLLITSDTHRADHLGVAFTRPMVDTPALNALAERGLYFTDCQSTTNVTNPSHVSVMTGIHPRDHQIVDNTTVLSSQVETLAEAFQGAGYRTFAAISTQHLGPNQSGLGQGFDRFDATEDFKRRGEEAIESVRDWIVESEGEPVFAWIHIFDAHAPYEPPGGVSAEYYSGGDPRDPAKNLGVGDVEVPSWIVREKYTDADYISALYRGEVDGIDASLRDLLELPRMRESWVAFTSDHGESLGTKGIWWDHAGLYLPNLQVPLIVAGPGVEAKRVDLAVQQVDVGRTLLGLAGVETEFPGRDLVEVVREEPGDEPRFSISAHGLQAGISAGDWYLSLDLRSFVSRKVAEPWEKGRVQLFDRRNGVDDSTDVREQHPDRARALRAALIEWLGRGTSAGLGSAVDLSAQAAANLEELGYGGYTERSDSTWWSEEGVDEAWLSPFED